MLKFKYWLNFVVPNFISPNLSSLLEDILCIVLYYWNTYNTKSYCQMRYIGNDNYISPKVLSFVGRENLDKK